MGYGAALKNNRLMVTSVTRVTPAYEAGLNVDDEIIAVNDYRILPDKVERLDERLRQYSLGATISLLVARRERRCDPRGAVRRGAQPAADPGAPSGASLRLARADALCDEHAEVSLGRCRRRHRRNPLQGDADGSCSALGLNGLFRAD